MDETFSTVTPQFMPLYTVHGLCQGRFILLHIVCLQVTGVKRIQAFLRTEKY